jgi:cephalosporin-C deacetylase
MQVDWPLDRLREHHASAPVPADLETFWRATIESQEPVSVSLTPVESGLVAVESFDVTFTGFGGDPVRAWLHLPAGELRARRGQDRLPGVVQYQGYNGGRGLAHEHVFWATAGYAHLVVDTRGQGSGWSSGATGDPVGSAPSQPGFLTRGVESRESYYYRRVYVDAVRAVEVLADHELVDAGRVAVAGASQGGGLALAVAALRPGAVAALLSDVPFLADFTRALEIAQAEPYLELVRYLQAHRDRVEQTYLTLSYFDVALLGTFASAPALFSVGLRDLVCPPSTVFAAHNMYAGPKRIEVYAFNEHEGGEAFHQAVQLSWLRAIL